MTSLYTCISIKSGLNVGWLENNVVLQYDMFLQDLNLVFSVNPLNLLHLLSQDYLHISDLTWFKKSTKTWYTYYQKLILR